MREHTFGFSLQHHAASHSDTILTVTKHNAEHERTHFRSPPFQKPQAVLYSWQRPAIGKEDHNHVERPQGFSYPTSLARMNANTTSSIVLTPPRAAKDVTARSSLATWPCTSPHRRRWVAKATAKIPSSSLPWGTQVRPRRRLVCENTPTVNARDFSQLACLVRSR